MKHFFLLLAIGIAVTTQRLQAQAHNHLNVGATNTAQDTPLMFENGGIFETNTGFVMTLNYTNTGVYAGYYQGNITLTSLSSADPIPPAPGSVIYGQLVSVDGPSGGVFSFWNMGATSPSISLASGSTGTNAFVVSQNNGSPGSDPFGHIHGRRFTATVPGVYLVGFRAFDGSTNGINGGPIHTPSPVLKFFFQAGINITSMVPNGSSVAVTFGAPGGKTCTLQSLAAIGSTNWLNVDALSGTDAWQTLIDTNAATTQKFYRIKQQ